MATETRFKPGDVVRLKGMPARMTVVSLSDAGVHCRWFDDDLQLQQATFRAESLVADGDGGRDGD